MVQRLSLQSAGQIPLAHCAGGQFPDVLRQRLRNVKFEGVGHLVARATRHAALATSVLLLLLLRCAAAMAAAPSAPNITGPTGIQTSGNVTVTWDAPPEGASSYNVAVYDWYNETWPLPSTNTGGCSYYVAGLMDNHGFIICLQAINADGPGPLAYSYFDVCSSQAAPTEKPVLTAPRPLSDENPGNPLSVTFTWGHVAEAGRYWLCVSEWHNTYWTTVFAVIVPDTGPNTTISYGPYTFLEGHYYSAWLAGSNPVGQGPYNECLYFGVSTLGHAPVAPTITDFAVEYSDAPIPLTGTQFEWSSTEKTLGYYFVLSDETANSQVGAWWEFDPGTGLPISFNLPSGITLVGGHLYWFGVAGWNPWGFGTWASVTFVAPAPLTVTADAKSEFYGAANPALTCTYTGLVNGDTSATFTGALSTTAIAGSAVGDYPISEGTLAATGYYYIGTFNAANLTVIPDTTPPVISIWYPNNGVFLLGIVSIGGEITDSGSGVNWSTLSVTLNGMGYGASHGDSFFCCEPSYLADGVYTLAVSVYDNAYNHATAQSTFTLDTTAPVISGLTPQTGSTVFDTIWWHVIQAEVTDAGTGVDWSSVTVTLDNGQAVAPDFIEPPYIYMLAWDFELGQHSVIVNAQDLAGNHAVPGSASFTYATGVVPPTITIVSPLNGASVSTTKPTIDASISQTLMAVDWSTLSLSIDGVEVIHGTNPPAPGNDFTYTPSASLVPGAHWVDLQVCDEAGIANEAHWWFSIEFQSIWLNPSDGSVLHNIRNPTISGITYDWTWPIVSLTLDNSPISPMDYTTYSWGFQYDPPADLDLGTHTLFVSFQDNSNPPNCIQASSSFTIVTDTSPNITYLNPAEGSSIYDTEAPWIYATFAQGGSNGVDTSSIAFYIDGIQVPIALWNLSRNFAMAYGSPLTAGQHTATVSVGDVFLGNFTSQTNTFNVVATSRQLAVISPEYGTLPLEWSCSVWVFPDGADPVDVTGQCQIEWSGGPLSGTGPHYLIPDEAPVGAYTITATATNIPLVTGNPTASAARGILLTGSAGNYADTGQDPAPDPTQDQRFRWKHTGSVQPDFIVVHYWQGNGYVVKELYGNSLAAFVSQLDALPGPFARMEIHAHGASGGFNLGGDVVSSANVATCGLFTKVNSYTEVYLYVCNAGGTATNPNTAQSIANSAWARVYAYDGKVSDIWGPVANWVPFYWPTSWTSFWRQQ